MKTSLYHIGRNKIKNQIYIEDESVSTSHAQLFIDKNKNYIIIDLASTNGVFINDKKINSPTKIKNKDLVGIGNKFYRKQDFSNAIENYEISKKEGNKNGVPLISTFLNQKFNKLNKKIFNVYKLVYTILFLIALIIIAIGLNNYNKSQNIIKNKILKIEKNDESRTQDIELKDKQSNKSENSDSQSKKGKEGILHKNSKSKKQRTDITYDFSCLNNPNDNGSNELITEFGDLTRNIQNTILKDVEISLSDEKKVGQNYVKELRKKKKFIDNGRDYLRLNRIMKQLISSIAKPRGVDYEIYYVDDKIKNVFTIGGNIIFYKGMYNFCENDSEIAAIIAHEIAHNELGHSTLNLKKQKTSNNFGIFGEIALMIERNISISFNQKQEAQADLFGIDLVFPTDYRSCSSIELWERMSKSENDFDIAENLFKSHPYSINRINCLKSHLTNNYNMSCN